MAGRTPKLNWTPCYNQYTATIGGKLHRLGKDQEKADERFKFLLRQAELDRKPDPTIAFGELADRFLDHVQENHTAERYRHCTERLQEFKDFLGDNVRAKDLTTEHVARWLKTKGKLTGGTERLYKSIILACLNWGAKPRSKGGAELLYENPLKGQLKLPQGESRGKEAVWSPEVFAQVIKHASPAFCDLVRILAWTGARPSTVVRIEARHYNKKQSRWDCEDLYRGRSEKKYVKFIRLLNDESRALVERLSDEHPTGPIFRNSFGDPWEPDAPQIYLFNMKHKFLATRDLEWPDGLCIKGLRHTFATNFLRQHPNELEYLRVLLGHKDYKMILAHYGHTIDLDASAFRRLDGFDPFKE